MSDIHELAEKFRNAIDAAVDDKAFNMYPFNRFPYDCCDMTCDLLAQYFLENAIQTVQINGEHKEDYQLHHVWLQSMDGTVIDITGDQFNGKSNMPNNIQPVYVGNEGPIHRIFCKKRKIEAATEFVEDTYTDQLGIPTRRQIDLRDAYIIIERYL